MKLFLSAETIAKFHPLSYGSALAGELPTFGKQLPKPYGGEGNPGKQYPLFPFKIPTFRKPHRTQKKLTKLFLDLKDGLTVKYAAAPIGSEDATAEKITA